MVNSGYLNSSNSESAMICPPPPTPTSQAEEWPLEGGRAPRTMNLYCGNRGPRIQEKKKNLVLFFPHQLHLITLDLTQCYTLDGENLTDFPHRVLPAPTSHHPHIPAPTQLAFPPCPKPQVPGLTSEHSPHLHRRLAAESSETPQHCPAVKGQETRDSTSLQNSNRMSFPEYTAAACL